MEQVGPAEKEASEVLHSLLSVERIEKQSLDGEQQVVVVTCGHATQPSDSLSDANGIQWHTPVTVQQTLFPTLGDHNQQFSHAIWQGHSIQISQGPSATLVGQDVAFTPPSNQASDLMVLTGEVQKTPPPKQPLPRKPVATPKKKRRKLAELKEEGIDPSQLEDNAQQVRQRFEKGCECQEENCFKGLSAEYVYRHRLNIAELTKAEHDMYLMGVTMAVLTNPEQTVRHKERRRLRAQYVFQGQRVCLDAFLYLENCTHYQLKRIRKHVMTHGVAPRVHGNHGKKPHNTFSLDIYRHATSFLRHFIQKHAPGGASGSQPPSGAPAAKCKQKTNGKTAPFYLPAEITRKTIHNAYREYCEHFEPSLKVMGYSTFRHFMKEQFPDVKFCKVEGATAKPAASLVEVSPPCGKGEDAAERQETSATTLIPVVLSDADAMAPQQQTTFIVAPVSQILHAPGTEADGGGYTSYQLTPATAEGYGSHQQLTQANAIAVATVPGGPQQSVSYGFTTL